MFKTNLLGRYVQVLKSVRDSYYSFGYVTMIYLSDNGYVRFLIETKNKLVDVGFDEVIFVEPPKPPATKPSSSTIWE